MADEPKKIYLVAGGGVIVMAYEGINALSLAGIHSRCVTGTTVIACELRDSLPPEIRDDIAAEEEWDRNSDTPVTDEAFESMPTPPKR